MCIVRHGYTPRDLTNDHYQTHGQHSAEKSLSDKWTILAIQNSINRDFTFLSKILFLMPTTPSHSCLTKFFRVDKKNKNTYKLVFHHFYVNFSNYT